MENWPQWLLFLGTAVVMLLAVTRLDDAERSAAARERRAREPGQEQT